MSAPVSQRDSLLGIARAERERGFDTVAQIIVDFVAEYDEAVRQLRIDQRVTDVAAIAHQWARARRARLMLPRREWKPCDDPEPETPESPQRPCFDYADGSKVWPEQLTGMCPTCRALAESHNVRLALAAKLSGLAARLERACLGPRPKKEA